MTIRQFFKDLKFKIHSNLLAFLIALGCLAVLYGLMLILMMPGFGSTSSGMSNLIPKAVFIEGGFTPHISVLIVAVVFFIITAKRNSFIRTSSFGASRSTDFLSAMVYGIAYSLLFSIFGYTLSIIARMICVNLPGTVMEAQKYYIGAADTLGNLYYGFIFTLYAFTVIEVLVRMRPFPRHWLHIGLAIVIPLLFFIVYVCVMPDGFSRFCSGWLHQFIFFTASTLFLMVFEYFIMKGDCTR